MRYRLIALFSAVLSVIAVFCTAATAEEAKNEVKGIFLLTDYPAVTLRPGATSTVNLKLQNSGMPPERLALSVAGAPAGWTATLIGGGQPVAAAMPATNGSVSLELRVEVPKDAPVGTTNLTVSAQGAGTNVTLPVSVTLATDLPAKLTLTPQLPELRGTSKSSFEFQLGIKNDSPKKVVVSLSATAPQNFDATFTEQYGSQELNALPLDAGQSKDVKLKVRPPNTVAAGKYKVAAKVTADDATATSELVLDITGQPKIDIAGREGVLSAKASAGGRGIDPGDPHQFRHCAGRADRAVGLGSARLEGELRAQDRRPHRSQREQGSAGPGHAGREGGCRRLRHHRAGRGPRRIGITVVPRRGHDLHDLGHRRDRAHRWRAAGHDGRRRVVRTPMSDNVIEVQGLTKRYDGVAVVNGISFSVARGEIFGLLGPNGAGKTTTILMLLGLSEISDGQARVLGHDPMREPLQVKRQVGYLPDQVGFYDNLTAADNLRYTARLMGLDRAEREEKIHASLGHVGLADVTDKRVATFSRGMRQRLGLAEILMKDAQIAILDEPTSALDPQATVELLSIIRELKHRGVSVLLSSHLLERVQSVCDRVALFNQGNIALIGTVPELGRQVLGGGFRVEVEAQGQGLVERIAAIPGVQRVEAAGADRLLLFAERDVRPEAAAAVVAAGGRLLRLSVEEPSLEAIYTRYFQTHEGERHAA